jgi:PmbA protein
MTKTTLEDHSAILEELLESARKAGADASDAVLMQSRSETVGIRLGEIEEVERSESSDLGLRVFIGQRQAIVSTTDLKKETLDAMVARAIAMARLAPEDPYCGLADPARLAKPPFAALDMADDAAPATEDLMRTARAAEDAARAVEGVTNSEGASASAGRSRITLATSHGFMGTYETTMYSLSASVLAGSGTAMERDYEFSSARHLHALDDPAKVGAEAGRRAVRRLNPKKPKSARVPVVFDPRVSRSLLGHLAGAINGQSVARGTSFLKNKMGAALFRPGIEIVDDPLIRRGLSSRPFDGEGVATAPLGVVEGGVLKSWILDTASAKQLGLSTTGHARRGTSGPPGPGTSNFYMKPGNVTPQELMADIADGIYVTELIGMGVNAVTGDYSRGAAGFRIENGALTHPVSEFTLAGNLLDMFAALIPANDLVHRYGMDAPTVRIDGMTLAGS